MPTGSFCCLPLLPITVPQNMPALSEECLFRKKVIFYICHVWAMFPHTLGKHGPEKLLFLQLSVQVMCILIVDVYLFGVCKSLVFFFGRKNLNFLSEN